jgi:translation elongation factor EF-Ts
VLKHFVRYQLGVAIEKQESDFAPEAAATAGLNR